MERASFTDTMARVPGPVTVVTTVDDTGTPRGFTADSFTSVSLDPPLVLVCLDKGASTHAAFAGATRFAVNVLAQGQEAIALRFAASGTDRFAAGDTKPDDDGLPVLPGAVARVICSMHSRFDAGDHTVLVGRVEKTCAGEGTPLVHHDRSFSRPVPLGPPLEQLLTTARAVTTA